MNQAPWVSKNGTCDRTAKPHRKSHVQHKSLTRTSPDHSTIIHAQPFGPTKLTITIENPTHGTEGRNEREKNKNRLDKRNALGVSYDRGSKLGMFKNERVLPDDYLCFLKNVFNSTMVGLGNAIFGTLQMEVWQYKVP